jgi:hypothetical protein
MIALHTLHSPASQKHHSLPTCFFTFQTKTDFYMLDIPRGERCDSNHIPLSRKLVISAHKQRWTKSWIPISARKQCNFAHCIWLIVSIFHVMWFQPVCLQHTTYHNDIQLAMTTPMTMLWFGLSINTAHAQTHSVHTVFKMTAIKPVGSSYKA